MIAENEGMIDEFDKYILRYITEVSLPSIWADIFAILVV